MATGPYLASATPSGCGLLLIDVPVEAEATQIAALTSKASPGVRTLLIFPTAAGAPPALTAFADAYLTEPFHPVALVGTIRELLDRSSPDEFSRTVTDNMAQLAWITDAEGRAVGCNRRWYEYTGQSPEQAMGYGWRKAHHPDHAERILKTFKTALEAGHDWDETFPLLGKDGGYRWFRSRVMPLRDAQGRITGWCGTSADINREHHFRELADSIPHCIWVTGTAGMEYLNRWYLDYTGFSERQAYTRGSWKTVLHPDDRPKAEAAWAEFLRSGASPDVEYRMKRASDGAFRWHLARGTAIRDSSGEIVRWIGTITDIHDRKSAEQALREAQKLESVGLLAGGIAHDFNNLLVGIIGNASLAKDLMLKPEALRECLVSILQAGEQAAHLTRQLLAYAGKGRFVIEAVNLAGLVNDSLPLLERSFSKKISFYVDAKPDLPPVESDRSQIQQILMNLVLNSAESIGDAAGLISIRVSETLLDATYVEENLSKWVCEPGRYVYLEVSDTGAGMADEVADKIFDPFFTTKFQGRGLGLAAVAGIVRAHGGGICVDTSPGAGATIRVFLPAAQDRITDVAEPALAPTADLQGSGAVLVVDDEEMVRQVARLCLHKYGYEVLEAENAQAAIDVVRVERERLRMVLLDLNMPGMSGGEALPFIRMAAPDLPIIVSSGFNEAEALSSAPGASGFIQKPYTVQTLASKIQSVLKPN